jgi:hypothetical protein
MTAAVEDTNWLEPDELYLMIAPDCEIDRPVFQGDVFSGVNLPELPTSPVPAGPATITFVESLCMVVPHPCQCYYGDKLRQRLTVAPVKQVASYDNFRADHSGAKDKFALPDLPVPQTDGTLTRGSHVADLGRLTTVGSRWLEQTDRVACLSHMGLGLLAKRVLGFQLRYPATLANTMAYTAAEWSEAYLMQAWVRRYGKLKGFSAWLREPRVLPGVNGGEPVAPSEVRAGAADVLLAVIAGEPLEEPPG